MSKSNLLAIIGIIVAVIGVVFTQKNSPVIIEKQSSLGEKSPVIEADGNVTINYEKSNDNNRGYKSKKSLFSINFDDTYPDCSVNGRLVREILSAENLYQKLEYQLCINKMERAFSNAKNRCEFAAINLVMGSCYKGKGKNNKSIYFFSKSKQLYELSSYQEDEYQFVVENLEELMKNVTDQGGIIKIEESSERKSTKVNEIMNRIKFNKNINTSAKKISNDPMIENLSSFISFYQLEKEGELLVGNPLISFKASKLFSKIISNEDLVYKLNSVISKIVEKYTNVKGTSIKYIFDESVSVKYISYGSKFIYKGDNYKNISDDLVSDAEVKEGIKALSQILLNSQKTI